jgi:hypothetical protein
MASELSTDAPLEASIVASSPAVAALDTASCPTSMLVAADGCSASFPEVHPLNNRSIKQDIPMIVFMRLSYCGRVHLI